MLPRAIVQEATRCRILIGLKGLIEEQSTRSCLRGQRMSVVDNVHDMLTGSTDCNRKRSGFSPRARSFAIPMVAKAAACRRRIGRRHVWRPG